SFWLGGLIGMVLHFLLNFPIYLKQIDLFGLGENWIPVLLLWVLAMVVLCAVIVSRLASRPSPPPPGVAAAGGAPRWNAAASPVEGPLFIRSEPIRFGLHAMDATLPVAESRRRAMPMTPSLAARLILAAGLAVAGARSADAQQKLFELSSTTFKDGQLMP